MSLAINRRPRALSVAAAFAMATTLGTGLAVMPIASAVVPSAAAATVSDRSGATFVDSAGLRSTYHLSTSKVQGPVRGVVIYLDGDGQYGVTRGVNGYALGGNAGLVAQAGAKGYAVAAPVSPDTSSRTWWRNGTANARYVSQFVRQMQSELGVQEVRLVGFSGGSQLITKHLLPTYSSQFTSGGALITGGGGAPSSAPNVRGFTLHWMTGSLDTGATASDGYNALADAQRGYNAYKAAGAQATITVPQGKDHGHMPAMLGTTQASLLPAAGSAPAPAPAPAPSRAPAPAPTPAPAPSSASTPASKSKVVLRMGTNPRASVKDSLGNVWSAASGFNGGWYAEPVKARTDIRNTADDRLYRGEMAGWRSWSKSLPNDTYDVTLRMREGWHNAPGRRVFSVAAEGRTVLSDIDIYKAAGKNAAYDRSFRVQVRDGSLDLRSISERDVALLSAVKVSRAD